MSEFKPGSTFQIGSVTYTRNGDAWWGPDNADGFTDDFVARHGIPVTEPKRVPNVADIGEWGSCAWSKVPEEWLGKEALAVLKEAVLRDEPCMVGRTGRLMYSCNVNPGKSYRLILVEEQ